MNSQRVGAREARQLSKGAIGEWGVESQWGNGSQDVIDFEGGKVLWL